MSLLHTTRNAVETAKQRGLREAGRSGIRKLRVFYNERTDRYQGDSVLSTDWDALVVLEACRVDALQTVAAEFEFLPNTIPTRYSVGSASDTWMEHTFSKQYLSEANKTTYVTANPNTVDHLPKSNLNEVVDVWKSEYDEKLGTTPARPVTDYAITTHRNKNPHRLIIHYMQPHFPSIPDPLGFGIRQGADNPEEQRWVWTQGKPDQYSREELWDAYIENLRYVLEELTLLFNNITANKMIITSDHGNAFGEHGLWGHPHQQLPVLREVPWVQISTSDSQTYSPDVENIEFDGTDINEKLKALGYKQ
jgi:hypothetical protein